MHGQQVRMYYGSGTVDNIASGQSADAAAYAAGAWQTLRVHRQGSSNFIMADILQVLPYVISRLRQSIRIEAYLRNSPAKFHPDPI